MISGREYIEKMFGFEFGLGRVHRGLSLKFLASLKGVRAGAGCVEQWVCI